MWSARHDTIGAFDADVPSSSLAGAATHEPKAAFVDPESALHEVRPASHFDISRLYFDDTANVDA